MHDCKENNDQAAAVVKQAAARDSTPQQAAGTPPHNAQALTLPLTTAADLLLHAAGHDNLSTQAHASLPEAHPDTAQAVPPTDQAFSPQANAQVSLLPEDLSSQGDLSNNGFQGPSGPAGHAAPKSAVQGAPDADCKPAQPAAPAGSQQPARGAQPAAQQIRGHEANANEATLQAENSDAAMHVNGNQQCEQSAAQELRISAEANEQQQQSSETAVKMATNEADPGNAAAEQSGLVRAGAEADALMEEVDNRSAAVVFEQTVMDCKSVLSEASSILLNKESQDGSTAQTSRIAASERATLWHNELQGLLKRCKMPQLYIGVLGDTGMSLSNCKSGQRL